MRNETKGSFAITEAAATLTFLPQSASRTCKKRFTNIRNCLVIPYIHPEFLDRISKLKERFDETFYPSLERVPLKYAIIRRNEWMIDKADVLFACVCRSWGGAAQTLEYARQRKKIIEYLP